MENAWMPDLTLLFSLPPLTPTFALSFSLLGSVVIKMIHSCTNVIPVWHTVCVIVYGADFVCLFILLFSLSTYCLNSVRDLWSNILYPCLHTAYKMNRRTIKEKGEEQQVYLLWFSLCRLVQSWTWSDLDNPKSSQIFVRCCLDTFLSIKLV